MNRNVLLFLLIIFYSCQPKDMTIDAIETIFSKQKGTFAVAFKNLETGETLFINEHEMFHAASTMKTPVMVEVFKQASEGKFSLEDSLVLKNEFKSIVDGSTFSLDSVDDSEQKLYEHLGEKRTIDALMYDMIIVSSNLATNMMIELVDAKNVTASMREIGADQIQVLRGVEDGKAYEKGMNNVTSAYDLMILFEKIAKGEMVSKEASLRMEKILLDQKFNEIIPARLPEEVKVAHKTGNITGVRHDSGIVILPDGNKYVIVLLSKELEDEEAGIKAMAEVSKLIYDVRVAKINR
jgi:beta-lactamase class A